MKLTLYLFATVILFSSNIFAQNNKCNCLENLNKLILKTEENYAGFPSKVNNPNQKEYQKLIQILKTKTAKETSSKQCFYLLKEYVRYFKDKHFILSYSNVDDYDREIISFSENELKEYFLKNQSSKIEGIWTNSNNSLTFAIQKFPNDVFKAIVIKSEDNNIPIGLVYLTLTPSKKGYIAKEYNSFISTDIPAKQKGNLLQIWNHLLLGKIYPQQLTDSEKYELSTWNNNNNGLDFQKLSSKTAYLKIPTFFNNDDKIQQLVSKNDSIIKTCDNLIIDLTGNGGGNTGWVPLLPYLMTNPVVQYDTYLRTTTENIKLKLADLKPFVVNPIPDEYKKYFPNEVLVAYKKAYQELPKTTKSFYPIPGVTFPLDSILSKPNKIGLIVDNFCGSSTEYFFFLSKQSKKTISYGINTIGMMDYEGMSIPTELPYEKYILTIPISKSNWTDKNPIDQKGFQPDIILNKIEQEKWLEFVLKDLEQK